MLKDLLNFSKLCTKRINRLSNKIDNISQFLLKKQPPWASNMMTNYNPYREYKGKMKIFSDFISLKMEQSAIFNQIWDDLSSKFEDSLDLLQEPLYHTLNKFGLLGSSKPILTLKKKPSVATPKRSYVNKYANFNSIYTKMLTSRGTQSSYERRDTVSRTWAIMTDSEKDTWAVQGVAGTIPDESRINSPEAHDVVMKKKAKRNSDSSSIASSSTTTTTLAATDMMTTISIIPPVLPPTATHAGNAGTVGGHTGNVGNTGTVGGHVPADRSFEDNPTFDYFVNAYSSVYQSIEDCKTLWDSLTDEQISEWEVCEKSGTIPAYALESDQ